MSTTHDPAAPTPDAQDGPDAMSVAVRKTSDPRQLEEHLEGCFQPGGDLKPDKVELARTIAREAPVLDEDLIARIRSHAGLIADLVRNEAFTDAQASELVVPLLGAVEGAPDNMTQPSDRTRAKVARWAARGLAAYAEAGREVPDEARSRLVAILERPVDELADWGAKSPARSAAAHALGAMAVAEGEEKARDFYERVLDLEDAEGYLPILFTHPDLPRELRLEIVRDHPTEDVVTAIGQSEDLAGDEEILERALGTSSAKALVALFGDANREHWEAIFGRLLSVDASVALRVLRERELKDALTPSVFEEAAPYFAAHESAVLLHLLRRAPDLVKPNLTSDDFRTLFLELRDEEPEAALEMLSTGRELAEEAITADDLAPMVEEQGLNVRMRARLMARAMDLELPEELMSLQDGLMTRGGLTRWLAQESGRENGEDLILTYLEAAENVTGGRQEEGDRFQQTVATCAVMAFRPSPAFIEAICERWPWARQDFAHNANLPEETRATLEGWADTEIEAIEGVASGAGSEAALEAQLEDAKEGLALAVALRKNRGQEAVELTNRLRDLLAEVDGTSSVHEEVRRQLAASLLKIEPLVSSEALEEIVDAVGTDHEDIVHAVAGRSATSDALLKRLLLARPDDETVREAATNREELRSDPELRAMLLASDDPETLYRMVGDAEVDRFRQLWLKLRDLEPEKAAEALDEAGLEAQRSLYMDDIMPLLRNGTQKVRALVTAYSMEVQSGSPPSAGEERAGPAR